MGSKRKHTKDGSMRDSSKKKRLSTAHGFPVEKRQRTSSNTYESLYEIDGESSSDSEHIFNYDKDTSPEDKNVINLIDSDEDDKEEKGEEEEEDDDENGNSSSENQIEIDGDKVKDKEISPSDQEKLIESTSTSSTTSSTSSTNLPEANDLAKNDDFIEFGFLSSDEDEDEDRDDGNGGINSVAEEIDDTSRPEDLHTNSQYPWVKNHDHSRQKEIADWLTMEMKDFVNYISPSSEEIVIRNKVVNTLKTQIALFWPGTEAHVFGSSATDLYLPGSDIDMVVLSDTGDYENRSRLYQLSSFLKAKKLATNVEVIASAKVPIIKFVDPDSNIHVDISFERKNGLDAARRIRKWLASTPGLRELVLVVKQFLRSRKLNNVHVGGLGGYATIIICYHFLRLHPKLSTESMSSLDNLGVLLIEFFELYGRNFSYDNLIISLDPKTEEPRYLPKGRYSVLNTARNTFAIVVQDPADPNNNITRSSYNLRDLKKAFGGAYQLLVAKCYELHAASYRARLGQLILGDIIKYKGKERHFRDERHMVVNEALISHEEETTSLDGKKIVTKSNDEFYFSDMTDSDETEEYKPQLLKVKSHKTISPTPVTNKAKDTKKLVESFLGLEKSEDENDANNDDLEYDPEKLLPPKPKSNLDKDVKRDYWRQKGLEL